MAIRRNSMLEAAYRLFSEKSIDKVSMPDVAKECGCGIATLYRYYNTKLSLVIATGIWVWDSYFAQSRLNRPDDYFGDMTASQLMEIMLDYFLDLYRNHSDILRFNQFFNVYVRGKDATAEQLAPYVNVVQRAEVFFHNLYLKAGEDGTVRTDIPELEMFTEILHIMLAVATRYAVGLIYIPEEWAGAESELLMLRQLLLERYTLTKTGK